MGIPGKGRHLLGESLPGSPHLSACPSDTPTVRPSLWCESLRFRGHGPSLSRPRLLLQFPADAGEHRRMLGGLDDTTVGPHLPGGQRLRSRRGLVVSSRPLSRGWRRPSSPESAHGRVCLSRSCPPLPIRTHSDRIRAHAGVLVYLSNPLQGRFPKCTF